MPWNKAMGGAREQGHGCRSGNKDVGVGLGTRLWVETWEQGRRCRSGNKVVGGGLETRLWVEAWEQNQIYIIYTPQLFPHTAGDALKQATSFYCKRLASANQCHTGTLFTKYSSEFLLAQLH